MPDRCEHVALEGQRAVAGEIGIQRPGGAWMAGRIGGPERAVVRRPECRVVEGRALEPREADVTRQVVDARLGQAAGAPQRLDAGPLQTAFVVQRQHVAHAARRRARNQIADRRVGDIEAALEQRTHGIGRRGDHRRRLDDTGLRQEHAPRQARHLATMNRARGSALRERQRNQRDQRREQGRARKRQPLPVQQHHHRHDGNQRVCRGPHDRACACSDPGENGRLRGRRADEPHGRRQKQHQRRHRERLAEHRRVELGEVRIHHRPDHDRRRERDARRGRERFQPERAQRDCEEQRLEQHRDVDAGDLQEQRVAEQPHRRGGEVVRGIGQQHRPARGRERVDRPRRAERDDGRGAAEAARRHGVRPSCAARRSGSGQSAGSRASRSPT